LILKKTGQDGKENLSKAKLLRYLKKSPCWRCWKLESNFACS